MSEIAYLIPAYQPTVALLELVRSLRALTASPIVIVNDGSADQCLPIFAEIGDTIPAVAVLHHIANRGKGEALKTGLAHAQTLPGLKGVVTLDADGQHRPEDAVTIGEALRADGGRLVLGCREFDATHKVPLRSRIGNIATRHVFKLLTQVTVSDSQTGLRGIPASLIEPLLAVPSAGYEFETEMLLLAVRRQLPIYEVPIPTIYIDNNSGSHFNPILDSLKIYFVLGRFALSSLLTAAVDLAIFTLAHYVTNQLLLSLICGRIVACCFQFVMGKTFVFMSASNTGREFLRYIALVVLFLCVTQAGIRLLVGHLGLNVIAAKVIMESGLFVVSFAAQKRFVFRQSAMVSSLSDK